MEDKHRNTSPKPPKPPSKRKNWVVISLLVFSLALILIVVAFWGFIEAWLEVGRVNSQSSEIQSLYSRDPSSQSSSKEESLESVYEISPRFDSLLKENPDTIGWLDIPGIKLSLPVVQRDDSYYLNHDFYGKDNVHGTIFASQHNNLDPNKVPAGTSGLVVVDSTAKKKRDDNIILYGHNMLNNVMFHPLVQYRELEFFESNPFLSFDTLWEDGDYAVVAVFLASTDPAHGTPFPYHTMRSFSNSADKQNFIDSVLERSMVLTDTELGLEDEFVTLSTCDYEFSGERLVVVARKLRAGESKNDFSDRKVWENPSPLMPEIWQQLYG